MRKHLELRCRRSDGRRWRCTAPAMPHSSLCEKHYNQQRYSRGRDKKTTVTNKRIVLSTSSDEDKGRLKKQFHKWSFRQRKAKDEHQHKETEISDSEKPCHKQLRVEEEEGISSDRKGKKNEELSELVSIAGHPRVLRKYLPNGIMEITLDFLP